MLMVARVTMVSYVIIDVIITVDEVRQMQGWLSGVFIPQGIICPLFSPSLKPLPCCRAGIDGVVFQGGATLFSLSFVFPCTQWHNPDDGCITELSGRVQLRWYLVNGCSRFPVCDTGVLAYDWTWVWNSVLHSCNETCSCEFCTTTRMGIQFACTNIFLQ